jgi:peptidoglycan/xylan/chitin deacetylase (PgdA/CDA1 family)
MMVMNKKQLDFPFGQFKKRGIFSRVFLHREKYTGIDEKRLLLRNQHSGSNRQAIFFTVKHNYMKNTFLLFLLMASVASHAQNEKPWQGKKCAVVITYDDAINQHLDNAIPVLDSLGLKATFYVTAFSTSLQTRLNDWKKIAVKGHDLGNHTLYHPCLGGKGREWVKPDYDMNHYTVRRMIDETRMTNLFLQALDGKTKRTFAFTCGDMKIGDSSFIKAMKDDFIAARAVRAEMHKINEIDLMNIDCYVVNGESSAQMIAWAKEAIKTNSLLVILFHGVGGGNSLNVSLQAHRDFLTYLKNNEKDIWIAPMIEVAEHIKGWQATSKTLNK